MTLKVFFTTILFSSQLLAQTLNHAGHFTSNQQAEKYKVTYGKNGSTIKYGNLNLEGTAAFESAYGIVTISGEDDSKISTLTLFDHRGKKIYTLSATGIINFKMSPEKNFCAFHDTKKIHLVNLRDKTSETFLGSNIFAFNDQGDLAYFDETDMTVHYHNKVLNINEPVYKIYFFRNELVFFKIKNISVWRNNNSEIIFNCSDGRIFDGGVFDIKLYISTKKSGNKEFIFNSFSTSDLIHFISEEEVHYPLANHSEEMREIKNTTNHVASIQHEPIRDPLNFFLDTVYQQVGNSYDEIQEYSAPPYLHEGVDLLGYYLQDVHSVKKGYVKAVLTTVADYHWRIAISNDDSPSESQGYLYAHLEELTIPYAAGDSVNEGDVVGQLVDFPVTGFVHCHFARIHCQGFFWNGDWWTFDNPLQYMTNFYDSIAPEFETTLNNDEFAFRDAGGNYLSPDSLYGNVIVISKVFDRINSGWHVDVNNLRYNLSPLFSPQTLVVDTNAYTYSFYNDGYLSGTYATQVLNTIYSRDISCNSSANYTTRDFYHLVTNSNGDDSITISDASQILSTANYPDGWYILRIIASDASGNKTIDSMAVLFINGNNGIPINSNQQSIIFSPNPFFSSTILHSNISLTNARLVIYNPVGEKVESIENLSGKETVIHPQNLSKGFYFFSVEDGNKIIDRQKMIVLQ